MMLTRYAPTRHQIGNLPTGEIDNWLKREFPERNDLFVYRHLYTRNFVISIWVNRLKGVFDELIVLGPRPWFHAQEQVNDLRFMLRKPGHMRQALKEAISLDRAQDRADQDEAELERETFDRFVRDSHPGQGGGRHIGRTSIPV